MMKPMHACKQFLRRFAGNQQGSVVIITGMMIFTLLGVTGAGIDLASQSLVQRKLQQSSDLASVAAGASRLYLNTNNAQQAQIARRYFNLNYPQNYNNATRPVPTINVTNTGIEISAQNISVPTTFGKMIGVNALQASGRTVIGATSESTTQVRDLIMILDNSGSMRGSKIVDLRTAATTMADELLNPNPNGNRIAIVPYASNTLTALTRQLSADFNTVSGAISAMGAGGGTNSADGFNYARSQIGYVPSFDSNAIRSVVWLTDGVNNTEDIDNTTLSVCRTFKNDGIVVFTIAFGSSIVNNSRVRSLMSTCASGTPSTNEGKFFFPAATGAGLQAVFANITNTINTLKISE